MNSPAARNPLADRPRTGGAWLPWAVLVGWLAGTGVAFWELELRDLGRFEDPAGSPPPVAEAQQWMAIRNDGAAPGPRSIQVVQVVDAGCRCNSYNDAHVTDVRERFRQSPVEFERIERSVVDDRGLAWIRSTPAALVFDATGHLVYAGPWSDSAWCGSSAGLVEPVVQQLLDGGSPQPGQVRAGGCFCHVEPRS